MKHLLLSDEAFPVLLADLSLDPASFVGRYSQLQVDVLNDLRKFVAEHDEPIERTRARAVLLFGGAVDIASMRSSHGLALGSQGLSDLNLLLESDAALPQLIAELYSRPERPSAFDDLDWTTLHLHQVGTTSLVFKIRTLGLTSNHMALKFVHQYFADAGPLALDTFDYAAKWRPAGDRCPHLVDVVASGWGWTLEEFIDGRTLDEYLQLLPSDRSYADQLRDIRQVFIPLVEAVDLLHQTALRAHADLTPSNVILQPREVAPGELLVTAVNTPYVLRFIDMGRNYLASTVIGRVSSTETRYIAPEVRACRLDQSFMNPTADYFSLGVMLGSLLCGGSNGIDDPVGDTFAVDPLLARVCADLIDNDPERRLGVIEHYKTAATAEARTRALAVYLKDLVSALEKSGDNRLGANDAVRILGISTGLAISMPKFSRHRFGPQDKLVLSPAERVALWRSGVSLVFLVLGFFTVIYTALLDLGWDPISIGRILSTLSYDSTNAFSNWQVRIVGGSFILASFQYLNIPFWRISFLNSPASRKRRVLVEALLWSSPILATAVTCVALVFPRPWPYFAALALFVTLVINELTARLRDIVRVPSTVGVNYSAESLRVDNTAGVSDLLGYWNPTLRAYCTMIFILAVLVSMGRARDLMVYAVAIAAINGFVFIKSQLIQQGPILRRSLGRVMIYGERASILGRS